MTSIVAQQVVIGVIVAVAVVYLVFRFVTWRRRKKACAGCPMLGIQGGASKPPTNGSDSD